MKTSWLTIALLALTVIRTQGQVSSSGNSATASQGTVLAQDTPWAIVSRDACQNIWQRVEYETLPDGRQMPKTRQYIELSTGLNFLQNGQWVESKEQIDILPDGTAAATQLQNPVYFPSDIAREVIRLTTQEGVQLQNGPAFLDFDDGTNIVLIGTVTNSVGELISSNQVLYPDIFRGSGFRADLLCTVRKSGFESDLVFYEKIPDPTSLGLGANARLQLLTEWFDTPEPAQTTSAASQADGLTDTTLQFGSTTIGQGKAFAIGTADANTPTPVYKSWLHLNGRTFLMEEVPYQRVAPQLEQLPASGSATAANANTASADSILRKVSAQRLLPPARLVQASTNKVQLAKSNVSQRHGLVLDYVTITASATNYVFQGDNTYYISGSIYSYGTYTFEGGAVLKFATNGSIAIVTGYGFSPSINWKAGAYRPVIFTAKDDNSVGESIGTGSPTGYYGSPMLTLYSFSSPATLTGLRMSYAKTAIQFASVSANIYDAQFINCQNGLSLGGANMFIGNALFANMKTNFIFQGGSTVNAQNATFSGSAFLATASPYQTGCSLGLTNCILANVTNRVSGLLVSTNGNYNGFYNCPPFGTGTFTNSSYPFQSVGAGSYYLANGCNFTNAGTSSIDSTLLTDLRKKTTYPPTVYSNLTISVATNFSPQVQRDTDTPDLGYHYDPLDYVFGGVEAQSNLTFTAGTAVSWFDTQMSAGYGIKVDRNATVTFSGTATAPCWLARYDTVQEGNWMPGTGAYWGFAITSNSGDNNRAPDSSQVVAQFTKFSSRNYNDMIFRDYSGFLVERVNNCEFWGQGIGGYVASINCTNCFFFRNSAGVENDRTNVNLTLKNCTVVGAQLNPVATVHDNNALWPVVITDCAFDNTGFNMDNPSGGNTNYIYCDYNAFTTNAGRTIVMGGHEVTNLASFNWQTSWLGNYYLPTNSPLVNTGSVTADIVGLYHFTTQTNQLKETNSVVDIGYHYVAVDTNGIPIDMNGDGIPDYLEDANGNGLVDAGETNWGLAILTQPTNQTAIQGSNATFSVTAAGVSPLVYQWYFNSGALASATNATLTLNNVQTNDAGDYHVIVTNSLGSATSSNATLTVLVPPVITAQPTNQIVIEGSNVTFSVTATGTTPLGYQWWFNGTNLLAGATNAALILTNARTTDAGGYLVVITNAAGSATSSNAVLTVQVAVPMLAIGGERIMQLTTNGDVVSWGGNLFGEFGDYTHLDSTNPVHVVGLTNIVKIASGLYCSLALDANGVLWAWGDNLSGQLGDGTTNSANLPVPVLGMSNVVAIAANYAGDGGGGVSLRPSGGFELFIAANDRDESGMDPVAVKTDGTIWAWGGNLGSIPTQIDGISNAVAVATGQQHTLALINDGTVLAWGANGHGQLGDGTWNDSDTPVPVSGLSNIVAICAGDYHNLALDSNGCVWAWGLNTSVRLGMVDLTMPVCPSRY